MAVVTPHPNWTEQRRLVGGEGTQSDSDGGGPRWSEVQLPEPSPKQAPEALTFVG